MATGQLRYAAADAYVLVELAHTLLADAAPGPRWGKARPCVRVLRADGSLAVPQPAEWSALFGAEEGAAAAARFAEEQSGRGGKGPSACVRSLEDLVPPRSRPAVGRVIQAARALPHAGVHRKGGGLALPCGGADGGEVVSLLDAEARGAGSVPAVCRALEVAPGSLLKTVLCARAAVALVCAPCTDPLRSRWCCPGPRAL